MHPLVYFAITMSDRRETDRERDLIARQRQQRDARWADAMAVAAERFEAAERFDSAEQFESAAQASDARRAAPAVFGCATA